MRKISLTFILLLSFVLYSCSGVSEETKSNILTSLRIKLPDFYEAEGITIYQVNPHIIKIFSGDNPWGAKYWVTFGCEFVEFNSNDKIYITGYAGFDKKGFITYHIDQGREGASFDFDIITVIVNGRLADESKYNLNRNYEKTNKNEPSTEISAEPSGKTNEQTINEARSFGLRNPKITNDGYLIYSENPSKISAEPNWVAKQVFDLFSDNHSIKGVRILSDEDNKTILGQYSKD